MQKFSFNYKKNMSSSIFAERVVYTYCPCCSICKVHNCRLSNIVGTFAFMNCQRLKLCKFVGQLQIFASAMIIFFQTESSLCKTKQFYIQFCPFLCPKKTRSRTRFFKLNLNVTRYRNCGQRFQNESKFSAEDNLITKDVKNPSRSYRTNTLMTL